MSGNQNIWTKSTRLIQGPHVDKNILMFKPNTIFDNTMWEKSPSTVQQKADKDTRQRRPANSSRKDDKYKRDDYDVGA